MPFLNNLFHGRLSKSSAAVLTPPGANGNARARPFSPLARTVSACQLAGQPLPLETERGNPLLRLDQINWPTAHFRQNCLTENVGRKRWNNLLTSAMTMPPNS